MGDIDRNDSEMGPKDVTLVYEMMVNELFVKGSYHLIVVILFLHL